MTRFHALTAALLGWSALTAPARNPKETAAWPAGTKQPSKLSGAGKSPASDRNAVETNLIIDAIADRHCCLAHHLGYSRLRH